MPRQTFYVILFLVIANVAYSWWIYSDSLSRDHLIIDGLGGAILKQQEQINNKTDKIYL
jgi:hypothetical protein